MAVGNVKRLAGPFTGAGIKVLPFGFKIFEPTDVFVALAEKENDPPKNLEYNADYSVEMNQDQEATPGGTVTLTNALNETQIVSVGTDIPYTQTTQLTNYIRFPPEVINTALDRTVVQIQQLVEQVSRALITDPTDTITPRQLRDKLLAAVDDAVAAAAKSKEYADKLLAFKDQILTVSDNIKSVGITAENAEAIAEIAKNIEELLKSKDYASEAKDWAEKANAITGGQALIMPGGTSPLPVLDWIAAKPHVFKSVAEMKAAKFLAPGMTAVTQGYYEPGDGGMAVYTISERQDMGQDDAGALHFIASGLCGVLVVENGTCNVKQFGARGDGVTDDSGAVCKAINYAVKSDTSIGYENYSVLFPAGTYAITKNNIFSDFDWSDCAFGIAQGLSIFGNGRTSSIIKLITKSDTGGNSQEKWLYDNGSVDSQKFEKLSFYNLGLDTDNYSLGNGFKLTSKGGEKQTRFFCCEIRLGNVLSCNGTGNADLNRFISCNITAYNDLLTLNNAQSVSTMFVGTDINLRKNLISVRSAGGGDVAISDCNIEMHEGEEADSESYYLVNIAEKSALDVGNCHYYFSKARFELHGAKKCLVNTPSGNFPVDVTFDSCWFGYANAPVRDVVTVYPSKIVKFINCTLHDNFRFRVAGSFGSSGGASCGATIAFDSCCVGRLNTLYNRITIDKDCDFYRVNAINCYKQSASVPKRQVVLDFDYGWDKSTNYSISAQKKLFGIKNTSSGWPAATSDTYDIRISIPKNIFITKIYIYRPALSGEATAYQLHIGSDDKSVVIGSSAVQPFNQEIVIDLNNVGYINFDTLRLWATGEASSVTLKGYGYVEYI